MIRIICTTSALALSAYVASAEDAGLRDLLRKETGGAVIDITASVKNDDASKTQGDIVGLTGVVTAEPATFTNQFFQLAGAAVGRTKASNTRYLYVYRLNDIADKKILRGPSTERLIPAYVLAPAAGSTTYFGAPIAITGNVLSDPKTLEKPLEETLKWAIPDSIRQTWKLDDQPKYIAVSKPLPNLPIGAKVLATGALEWNIYKDESAIAATNK